MKFRKKPVVIEAVQLRWLNWNEVCDREKYMRGYVEEKWHDYTEQAEACIRAALGIDRAAADAVHEPESKP